MKDAIIDARFLMKRKAFLQPFFLAVLLVAGAPLHDASAEPAPSRPNVLFVMTDDMGYGDLSCHDNPVLKTPHLDRLHGESVRLTDFHVSPVCAPTRASLLTGRDALHGGVWTTTTDRSMLFAELPTVAEAFTANGYRTAMVGKWHLGAVPPYRPGDRGFEEVLYEPGGMIGMTVEAWNNDVVDPVYEHNGTPKRFSGYRTDIWFDEAMRWMKARHEAGEPFFAYVATMSPHGPHWVPEKYSEPYRHLDEGRKRGVADFFGMIANIDENMGRLDAFLRESGLYENTLLVFLTDNGGTAGVDIHNAGMRGRKGDLYEGGHRVPCFVRWPAGGMTGGVDRDGLTAHLDWFPTLAEICRLEEAVPENLEGFSMAALLRGETDTMPQRVLFHRSDHARVKQGVSYRPDRKDTVVMTGQWRFINDAELYHVGRDPAQEQDIASQHPRRVAAMRTQLRRWWKSIYPENYDLPRSIRVGPEEEVLLTPLYGRPLGDGSLAFQAQVRSAARTKSEWPLEVTESGTYRIEVRRWPREVDAALTGGLPPFHGEFGTRPAGKALPVDTVRLTLGDRVREQAVPDGAAAVVFEVELPAGPVSLHARFLDAEGAEIGDVYYLYIRSLP
jgi:arylsulfatase